MKLGVNREQQITDLEEARLRRLPLLPHLQAATIGQTPGTQQEPAAARAEVER
jgi:hypothetical protein